jgi:hypothetical protein
MNDDDPEYWASQLRAVFAAVGNAMGERRLTPETLKSVRLADDQFSISHVPGTDIGSRKGYYLISTDGGRWKFLSGKLQRLARAASKGRPLKLGHCEIQFRPQRGKVGQTRNERGRQLRRPKAQAR